MPLIDMRECVVNCLSMNSEVMQTLKTFENLVT